MKVRNALINAVVLVLIAAPAFAAPAQTTSTKASITTTQKIKKASTNATNKLRTFFKSPKVVTTKKKVVKSTKATFSKLKKVIHNATK